MKKNQLMAFLCLITLGTSCSNDDNSPVNEQELITTIQAVFVSGEETVTLTSKDLDGDGPLAPVITVSGNFKPNKTYSGRLSFKNELVIPIEDITQEIEEEGASHQVFYETAPNLGTFVYTDADENGKPIGLLFTFTTSSTPKQGDLKITLRHRPQKNAEGVASGNITNAGGATDAEVIFPVAIE